MAVADRDHADPARPLGHERAPVADRGAPRELAHLHQAALERHHRLQRKLGASVRRLVAVGDQADANPIEARLRQIERRRAVRGMDARRVDAARREALERGAELDDLVARELEVLGVGVGEMRVDAREPQSGERGELADETIGLRLAHAGASHPRVDLDMEPERAPDPRRGGGIRAHDVQVRDRGVELVGDRLVDLAGQERRQHDDRAAAPRLPELDALVQRRHAEVGHALAFRRLRDLDGAMPVGVCLHDQQHFVPGPEMPPDRRQVGGEPVEIHLDPSRNRHRHFARSRIAPAVFERGGRRTRSQKAGRIVGSRRGAQSVALLRLRCAGGRAIPAPPPSSFARAHPASAGRDTRPARGVTSRRSRPPLPRAEIRRAPGRVRAARSRRALRAWRPRRPAASR